MNIAAATEKVAPRQKLFAKSASKMDVESTLAISAKDKRLLVGDEVI